MTTPIKRPNHQAFLWVLTEPGQAVDLEEFHGKKTHQATLTTLKRWGDMVGSDWYNNEHVPLRMSSFPEFLTGARYLAIDSQQPTFSAFYNISSMSLFQQPNYTDLRVHRSSRHASLFNRIWLIVWSLSPQL
ncbi:hypothetical protein CROQUDRAFT_351198 [Cronartium quercuum f. sp. fusiforme G11]|uniref:Uncharacterized protein n=1 Tax=Cronartium quercuum f. sp. fusiforme G11 TaxID=708437 RepID=A0A9P6NRY7_9BASI|nr:hypothetical protein CROQUDRAFT_351198 [Cronartium quercuum f. sp. fusiforme G11]